MDVAEFQELVKSIVKDSNKLKDSHTVEKEAKVNYACVFAQDSNSYGEFLKAANELGKVIDDTPTGPLFQIAPLDTIAGRLKLVKVRKPDPSRKERGDADFTVSDYDSFKEMYLSKPGFRLIERPKFEMIELTDSRFDVLAFFSNPPLDKQFRV